MLAYMYSQCFLRLMLFQFASLFKTHTNEIKDVKILNDDSRILSRDTKGNFHLWDIDTGNTLIEYSIPSADYIISSDNVFLITIMDDHRYRHIHLKCSCLYYSLSDILELLFIPVFRYGKNVNVSFFSSGEPL